MRFDRFIVTVVDGSYVVVDTRKGYIVVRDSPAKCVAMAKRWNR